jgi:transcriptional regulator with XRE-family HTH domain
LRAAVARIIRDIQAQHHETDQDTADRLGISIGTVRNARNEDTDLNALTIARIGAVYGAQALSPYNSLYGAAAHGIASQDAAPLAELADALAALHRAETPRARFDSLPTLKAAAEAIAGYINSLERWRIAA